MTRSGPGTFTTGSIMRHVAVMSLTGTIGLIAIFVVDLLSLLYVSWLGDVNLTAAVGYATTVLFLATSANIGFMIAVGAVVSRALGARERERARRLAASSLVMSAILSAVVAAAMMASADATLDLLGATGETKTVAHRFLMISLPSNVFMGLGMALAGILRAAGDAKRGMYVTLAGGIATAVIDPLLIFGAGLGTDGAAWATVFSRLVFTGVGAWGAIRVHDLVARPVALHVVEDASPLLAVAVPAVLTNIATPVANGFMTAVIAPYGDDAVAANAIITRLVPVAFGALFALSGAVGPIFGQNLGAKLFPRVRATLNCGLMFSAGTIVLAWLGLWAAQDAIVTAFKAQGETAELVRFFCTILAGTWAFHGALFVANSAFNNLGAPIMATAFNWGKATLGTIPFAWYGARTAGAEGALMGQGVGAILFGIIGVWGAYRVILRLSEAEHRKAAVAGAGETA